MPAVLWTAGYGGEGSRSPGQASTGSFASISETDICSDAHGRLVVFVRRLPWLPVQTFYSQELAKRYVDAPATAGCRAGAVRCRAGGVSGSLAGAEPNNRSRPATALSGPGTQSEFRALREGRRVIPKGCNAPEIFIKIAKKRWFLYLRRYGCTGKEVAGAAFPDGSEHRIYLCRGKHQFRKHKNLNLNTNYSH